MLPGFRFLFTAIVLSMSVLIFGLGAAALLRAAHEEFANLPSRRVMPEPTFARRNDGPPPTLALLRVDPPVAEKPAENVPAAAVPEATIDALAPAGQAPDARPAEPEKLAALPAEPMQAEAAKPEAPAKEASAEAPAAPGRSRGARCQSGSETRRDRGNAGTRRCHAACARAGNRYLFIRRQRRGGPDRDARRPRRHRRRKDGGHCDGNQDDGSEAGPEHRQKAGRRAGPGTAADCRAAGASGAGGGAGSTAAIRQPVRAITGRSATRTVRSGRTGRDGRAVGCAPLGPRAVIQRRVLDAEAIERKRQHGGADAGAATRHNRRIEFHARA